MHCFMLRKCLEEMNDDSDGDDINVQVSCACCGSVVKEANIDQVDENAPNTVDITDKKRRNEKTKRSRETTETNLLRSKQSGSTKFSSCFSCCCKRTTKKDKTMVSQAIDLHSPSQSSQDLSRSQVLRK